MKKTFRKMVSPQPAGYFLALFFGIYSQWALAALPIQHWRASSGAQVYFVESHGLPILDISVDFSAGSSADTPEKSGCAIFER